MRIMGMILDRVGLSEDALRSQAFDAVAQHEKGRSSNFAWGESSAECFQGSLRMFHAQVKRHPEEYFICRICGDGPWHFSWDPDAKPKNAICGNCTGAA